MGFVQSASNTGSGTTLTVTLGSASTVGNCLIGMSGSVGAADPITGVTIGGNADNWAVAKAATGTSCAAGVWTDQNCQFNSTSVVFSFTGGTHPGYVIEWAGVLTSAAVDKTNSGLTSSSTAFSSNSSGALTQASEAVIGYYNGESQTASQTLTGPGSPWTNLSQLNPTTAIQAIGGYQQVSATTAQTYSGSSSGTQFTGVAIIITLKLSASITVNLPALAINTAAFALTPPLYVSLPLIADTIADFVLTPGIGVVVNLPVLQINTADFPVTPTVVPKITVALPLLHINGSAPPLTPDIVPVPPRLIIALASRAGTDSFTNNYPQGITEFQDQTHYANLLSGVLSFVAANLAGNLLALIQTQDTAGLLDFTSGGVNGGDTEAEMFLESNLASGGTGSTWAVTAVNIQINGNTSISGTLLVTGTGQVNGDFTVNSGNTNIGNGSVCNLNFNPKIATPPNLAAVVAQTATLAQTQACLGALIQSLQNRGLVNLCGMQLHSPHLSWQLRD